MTARMKPASARPWPAPLTMVLVAIAAAAGLTIAGVSSTPALAKEPAALLAPAAVPFSTIVTPGALVETTTAITGPTITSPTEPTYQTIASGVASYYGRELAGNRTASGERFNPSDLTAAHRTLPLGSRVRVTNPKTGDSVIVRINDRGPFHSNRLIDLSEAAARQIGLRAAGSGRVDLAIAGD